MKYKIITIISLFLFLIGIVGSHFAFAEDVIQRNSLINSSLLKKSSGVVSLVAQSNRDTDYLDMTSYGAGILTITMGSAGYGAVVVSQDDLPQDIEIGYTFITTDFHSINNVNTISVSIPGNCYVYVSYNKAYTATFEPDTPDPSPSISPSPSPEVTPSLSPTPIPDDNGSNIPYHFDIPIDYYFVVIIILLGGVLICQFFKK